MKAAAAEHAKFLNDFLRARAHARARKLVTRTYVMVTLPLDDTALNYLVICIGNVTGITKYFNPATA
jgi:hypothetical protein